MVAFLILLALNVVDVWLTRRILAAGGVEKNPLLASPMRRVGVLPALIGVKSIVLMPYGFAVFIGLAPTGLTWALVALYAGVVGNNVIQWRRHG